MTNYKGLPLYEARINTGDEGMTTISFVDYPATMSDFQYFASNKKRISYSVADEDKHIVFGLVMAANMPIYRVDESGYEYYIMYSPETISLMAQKYLKDGYQNNVDMMHTFRLEKGIEMRQIFIKDSTKGINPTGFEDYEDGSLFAEFKVDNEDVWEGIKDGTYKGFSLSGIFESVPVEFKNNVNKNNTLMKSIKEKLRRFVMKFSSISTDKGVLIWNTDEDLKVGDEVFTQNEEGEDVAAPDGEYKTDGGKVITVAEGKVNTITDASADEETVEYSNFKAMKEKYEASFGDKEQAISDALSEMGLDGYVIDAGENFAIVDIWDGESNKTYHYDVSFDEEGKATLSNPYEVKENREWLPVQDETVKPVEETQMAADEGTEPVTEPVEDETDKRLDAVEATIKEIQGTLEGILEKINAPMDNSPEDKIEDAKGGLVSDDNEKLENLSRALQGLRGLRK